MAESRMEAQDPPRGFHRFVIQIGVDEKRQMNTKRDVLDCDNEYPRRDPYVT